METSCASVGWKCNLDDLGLVDHGHAHLLCFAFDRPSRMDMDRVDPVGVVVVFWIPCSLPLFPSL